MTQSLKVAQVEDKDYRRIYFAINRASEFSGHDRTSARQIVFPVRMRLRMIWTI